MPCYVLASPTCACRNHFIICIINVHQNWSEEAYNNKPFELPLSWVEPEMVRSHALNLHWRQAAVVAFTLIAIVADGRRHWKGPRQRAALPELQNVARMQAHASETAHVRPAPHRRGSCKTQRG
jgi:hypothetical protein